MFRRLSYHAKSPSSRLKSTARICSSLDSAGNLKYARMNVRNRTGSIRRSTDSGSEIVNARHPRRLEDLFAIVNIGLADYDRVTDWLPRITEVPYPGSGSRPRSGAGGSVSAFLVS